MTLVLRSVPCRVCGHRIGLHAEVCPYCGSSPAAKRKPPRPATPSGVARSVGLCPMCGGRMKRHRNLLERIAKAIGLGRRGPRAHRLACSSCGHVERAR